MKLALQLRLIPGNSESDRAKWAIDHGIDAIEMPTIIGKPHDELRGMCETVRKQIPICSFCGNSNITTGTTSFDFLDPDRAKRQASIDSCKSILKLAGDMGAVGQIVPPIFGAPRVPDLSPFKTPLELEEELMLAAARELGEHAAAHNTLFMLEPLNRYEQHYLRKQEDGVRIIEAAGVKGVGLLSDFFHMHIEETSTPETFRKIGKYTNHVHLADNTRMEPGTGDIDFVPALRELKAHGFSGYMAYECGITGDNPQQVEANLIKSLDYMRDCIAKA